jgi:hypothetical protein
MGVGLDEAGDHQPAAGIESCVASGGAGADGRDAPAADKDVRDQAAGRADISDQEGIGHGAAPSSRPVHAGFLKPNGGSGRLNHPIIIMQKLNDASR